MNGKRQSRSDSREQPCPGCGAVVPVTDGPTHPYMLSSPGCWAVYGEVLAREYQNPAFMARHQLTVDAYAVQHPGEPVPAARRSVLFHLVSLCAVFERGRSPTEANRILQRLGGLDLDPEWLAPPDDLGSITVLDVVEARGFEDHLAAVERWARSAWGAWSAHHPHVRAWIDRIS